MKTRNIFYDMNMAWHKIIYWDKTEMATAFYTDCVKKCQTELVKKE